MALSLRAFARSSDAVAAVASKLAKQKLLAELLRQGDDADVPLVVRYSDGRAFARTEERVLGVSGSLLLQAVLPIIGIDYTTLRPLAVKHGELGNALGEAWRPLPVEPELRLAAVQEHFDRLAATTLPEQKLAILESLWSRVGEPREAAYLAKIILGDLRTGVKEGTLIPAVAKAFARDEADVRRALLLVGDLDRVAVLARQDRLADAQFQLFHPIQFMLATPLEAESRERIGADSSTPIADSEKQRADIAKQLAESAGESQSSIDSPLLAIDSRASSLSAINYPLSAEPKLDGIRAQVHKQGDRVAIYTRTLDRTEQNFPDVVAQVRTCPGDYLIDGEIVAWRDGRVLPFANVQKRLGRIRNLASAMQKHPCRFIGFDLLYLGGDLLIDRPYVERRALLRGAGFHHVLDALDANSAQEVERAFAHARDQGHEGLMLKEPQSLYLPGKRGQGWLKLKTHLPTLDCVVTFAERGHGKRRGVLSDYTFAVWSDDPGNEGAKLLNVGKAYSGLTDAEILEMTQRFLKEAIETDGRIYRVQPTVVLEIAFDQIQKSDRHGSGYALRFPRIKTIRRDKRAEDADRLGRVIELYRHTHNTARDDAPPLVEESQLSLF